MGKPSIAVNFSKFCILHQYLLIKNPKLLILSGPRFGMEQQYGKAFSNALLHF